MANVFMTPSGDSADAILNLKTDVQGLVLDQKGVIYFDQTFQEGSF